MENPEEILHSLEEFSKLRPKDIPRELEDYLCFVAKTGDPVYQWGVIKILFKEKLVNVITDFYESCPSVEIPPCPNVDVFNYESMKSFILEKLDTFAAAPFTVQRISELLTTPRKEYNRIDKYMRALEKNILVVSTTGPGNRHASENGDAIVNGVESDHIEAGSDINVEEMDDTPMVWSRGAPDVAAPMEVAIGVDFSTAPTSDDEHTTDNFKEGSVERECKESEEPYVSIEPVATDGCVREEKTQESDVSVTITAIPAAVQKRRVSIEPVVASTAEPLKFRNIELETPSSPPQTESNELPTDEDETSDTNISSITESDDQEEIKPLNQPIQQKESDLNTSPDQIPVISEIIMPENDETEVKDVPAETPELNEPEPPTLPSPEEEIVEKSELKEVTVSSSSDDAEASNDADLKCPIDPIDDESRSSEDLPQVESSVDTISSDLETEETCDTQYGEVPKETITSIEICINEDSCQEAPTSNG